MLVIQPSAVGWVVGSMFFAMLPLSPFRQSCPCDVTVALVDGVLLVHRELLRIAFPA